jgi:hypothetical protein
MNRMGTSSPRPSPPQVCGGEGEDVRHSTNFFTAGRFPIRNRDAQELQRYMPSQCSGSASCKSLIVNRCSGVAGVTPISPPRKAGRRRWHVRHRPGLDTCNGM